MINQSQIFDSLQILGKSLTTTGGLIKRHSKWHTQFVVPREGYQIDVYLNTNDQVRIIFNNENVQDGIRKLKTLRKILKGLASKYVLPTATLHNKVSENRTGELRKANAAFDSACERMSDTDKIVNPEKYAKAKILDHLPDKPKGATITPEITEALDQLNFPRVIGESVGSIIPPESREWPTLNGLPGPNGGSSRVDDVSVKPVPIKETVAAGHVIMVGCPFKGFEIYMDPSGRPFSSDKLAAVMAEQKFGQLNWWIMPITPIGEK